MYPVFDREFLHLGNVPAVLHTCSESRAVGLKRYFLSFGTKNHPPKIYFNPVDDIVYFGSRQFGDEITFMLEYFRKNATILNFRDRIQRIAFTESIWKHKDSPIVFSRGSKGIPRLLASFPYLTELMIVKGDDSESSTEDLSKDYAGITLVKAASIQTMESLSDFALDAVLSTFEAGKQDHPEWTFKVSVMDFEKR